MPESDLALMRRMDELHLEYLDFFYRFRPHSSLCRQTLDMVYVDTRYQLQAA